ncbi:MAG: PH domain-containing protein [Thermoanaerobaculales bacterium]|nr:PH domain-containing protein [Thermoanaerobaculales bacterium]
MSSEPIVVEQSFSVQPEAVWQAITTSSLMRQWYFEQIEDFRPEVGFETEFDIEVSGRIFRHQWKVTEVVPVESITYTWRYEGFPGLGSTEWKLSKIDEGTKLVLTSTGIESFSSDIPEFTRERGIVGWEYFIQQSLSSFLNQVRRASSTAEAGGAAVADREQISKPDPAVEARPESPDSEPPELPSMVDGEEHHVDPRSVRVARFTGLSVTSLIALVPLILITVGWVVGGLPSAVYLALFGVWLVLATTALSFAYKWPAVHHKRLRYLVDEGGLRIRRGVFWRTVIWIPISRVQHTDFTQGPLQRRFDLATLTVHTAGTAGASISLAGLEHTVAVRLCDHLRPDRATDAD